MEDGDLSHGMRTLTLGHTGLTTTVLGYGCAGLMRPNEEKDRVGLLTAAFDAGVRHFDVARYYGHGGAEGVLGKFLADGHRRDAVTITTKFGMEPSSLGQISGGRSIMGLARRVASVHPWVRKAMSAFASGGVRTGRFDPASARHSLETSLRELRTDRIDLFLLHEATLADIRPPGLLEFLEDARRAGKIRAFGLGSEIAHVPDVVAQAPVFAQVVQVANGFGHWDLARLPADPGRVVNTHGALKILQRLHPFPKEPWGKFGPLDEEAVAGLLLGLSRHENPGGITLFSSIRPERIRANVAGAVAREASMSTSDWAEFKRAAKKFAGAEDDR